jgi:alanine dehydrogenase
VARDRTCRTVAVIVRIRVEPLRIGVIGRSAKEDERRVPIHPQHLERIDADLLARIHLEEGYGDRFGVSDAELAEQVAGVRSREDLIAACDVVLAAKPLAHELTELREGQVLWGWPHCVQDADLTQHAIDRRLTLIAFEAMNHWNADGSYNLHVFHRNNEIAGYAAVLHAMQLAGITGAYGPRLTAVVIGFGATARGAVTALNAHGVHDVDVLTVRDVAAVAAPIPSVRMVQLDHDGRSTATVEGDEVPLAGFLAEHDLVVNCVLQDPNAPLTFLDEEDLDRFARGSVIVDVSCDEGMGFGWARPTSFAEPAFTVGDGILYYAVDHTPSYLWNAATWENSLAILPFLRTVLDGPDAWESDETIRRAIEIRDGVVRNPDVLAFQRRAPTYPHPLTR